MNVKGVPPEGPGMDDLESGGKNEAETSRARITRDTKLRKSRVWRTENVRQNTIQNIEDDVYDEKKKRMFKYACDKSPRNFQIAQEHLKILKHDFEISAICFTIQQSNVQDIKEKLRNKLSNEKDDKDNTALHYAAKAGNLDICKLLYNDGKGTDIKAKGQYRMNPLQFAARYGSEKRQEEVWDCIKWIMTKNNIVDITENDKYGFTILHHAIQNNNWKRNPFVVSKLIEEKWFKITETDRQGNTSMHLAAQFDIKEGVEGHKILDIFLDNPNIPNEDVKHCIETKNLLDKTPLHIACSVGNHESLKDLLRIGKEHNIQVQFIIQSPDMDGFHPLHLAIESGNLEMMETLIEEGASVTETAFDCAAR